MGQFDQSTSHTRKKKESPESVEFSGFLTIYVDAIAKRTIKENPQDPDRQFLALFRMMNDHMSVQLRLEDDGLSFRALIQDRDVNSPTAGKMLSLHSKDFGRLLDLVAYVHCEQLNGNYTSLLLGSTNVDDF